MLKESCFDRTLFDAAVVTVRIFLVHFFIYCIFWTTFSRYIRAGREANHKKKNIIVRVTDNLDVNSTFFTPRVLNRRIFRIFHIVNRNELVQ